METNALLQKFINEYYRKSSLWQRWSLAFRLILYVVGIASIFFTSSPPYTPIAVACMSVVVEIILWRSDFLRGKAEEIKRVHEYSDGFGIIPSGTEIACLRVGLGKNESQEISEGLKYYSNEVASPLRTLKNLHESSWFSWDLAKCSGYLMLGYGSLLVIAGLVIASLAPFLSDDLSMIQMISHTATALVLAIFSLGILRRGVELLSFSKESENIASRAEQLWVSTTPTALEVCRLLGEYQTIRAQAPALIPFLWKMKRNKLDQIYQYSFPNTSHV